MRSSKYHQNSCFESNKIKKKAVQLRQMNWKKRPEYDVTTFRFYQILSRKSGLFGSRDTISLRKDYNKKKNG
jgi:hypothetical protein